MSTLRELTDDLLGIQALAMDPEIPDQALADTIEALGGEFNEKAVRVVHVIIGRDSDIETIDDEIARLQARKKAIVNAKDRLKEYLRFNMEATGITKINSPLIDITLAKGRDIAVIEDEGALPDDYVRVKTTKAPDKREILAALKNGVSIPGARLEKSQNSVRIK